MRDNRETRPVVLKRVSLLCLLGVLGLALATTSCDDKKSDKVTTPTKEVVASGPLEKLKAPANVLVYGGTDNPIKLLSKLDGFIGAVAGAATKPEMAAAGLQMSFKLSDAKVIDLSKPIRVAVFDPKKNPNPLLVAFGTTGKDKLKAALPSEKKADQEGNAFSYPAGGRTVYVNFIDDFVVMTHAAGLFKAQRPFVKTLLGSKVTGQAAVILPVGNITTLYKTEMAAAQKQMGALSKQLGKQPGLSPEQFSSTMKTAFEVIGDLDSVLVTTRDTSDGGLLLAFDVAAKKGSETNKMLATVSPSTLAGLAKLPVDAAFAVAMSYGSGKSVWSKKFYSWSLKMMFGGNQAAEKYLAPMTAYMESTTGEVGVAGHSLAGKDDLGIVMTTGIKDFDAAKKAWDDMTALYKDKDFLEAYKKLGIDFSFKKAAYKIGDVAVSTSETKLTKELPDKPKLGGGAAAAMLEGVTSTHMALTKDGQTTSFGKDPKPFMEAWLGGKVSGGLDKASGVVRAKKNAAAGSFFFLYGSPLAVARKISIGGKKLFPQAPAGPTPKNGMAFSLGAKDGRLHVVLDVPSGQAKSLVQLATLARTLR